MMRCMYCVIGLHSVQSVDESYDKANKGATFHETSGVDKGSADRHA